MHQNQVFQWYYEHTLFVLNFPLVDNKLPKLSDYATCSQIILLLSHPLECIALPFLTEYHYYQYPQIKIFATEPVKEFLELWLLERVEQTVYLGQELIPWYTKSDIAGLMDKIETVHFQEMIMVNPRVSLNCFSTGTCIGGCGWNILVDNLRFCWLGDIGNSLHSKQLDQKSIQNADYLLLGRTSQHEPRWNDIGKLAVDALQSNKHIVIPVNPFDRLYDLITVLRQSIVQAGFQQLPMHVLAKTAKVSLHLANICGEWLCEEYQKKLYLPNHPFLHGQLLQEKLLFTYDSVYHLFQQANVFQSRTIIFVSMQQLKPLLETIPSQQSCIIVTDDTLVEPGWLSIAQKKELSVHSILMDPWMETRNFQQLFQIPAQSIVPESLAKLWPNTLTYKEHTEEVETIVLPSVKAPMISCRITQESANLIFPADNEPIPVQMKLKLHTRNNDDPRYLELQL